MQKERDSIINSVRHKSPAKRAQIAWQLNNFTPRAKWAWPGTPTHALKFRI